MNLYRVLPNQLGQIVTVILTFAACIFLGTEIGAGEFSTVLIAAGVVAVINYILGWAKYTVLIAMGIAFLDIIFYFGFYAGTPEQTAIFLTLLVGALWWFKRREAPLGKALNGVGLFRLLCFLFVVYLGVHYYANYKDPIILDGFSVKGAAKNYFRYSIAFIAIAYFFSKSSGQIVSKRPSLLAAQLLMFGVVFNVVIRVYFLLKTRSLGVELNEAAIDITLFHFSDNIFALRTLSPFAALIGAVCLTSSSPNRPSPLFSKTLLALSVIGAVLSSGRATLIFCVLLASAVFIIRRQGLPIMVLGACFFFFAVAANVAPDAVVRPLPWALKRSVAKIVVTEDLEEEAFISGSTAWRTRIFLLAYDFWKTGGPRMFWTGQSAAGMNETDATLLQGVENAHSDFVAIRLGATHNLITDLLVMIGLIGAILYYAICFTLIYILWSWYRRCPADWETKDWTLVSLMMMGFYVVYASIGGSPFWSSVAWVVIFTTLIFRREAKLDSLPDPHNWVPKELPEQPPVRELAYLK